MTRLPDPPGDMPADVKVWATDLVRVVQGIVDDLRLNGQRVQAPTELPLVVKAQIIGLTPTLKATKARLVYCTDATGGAVVAYCDLTTWRRIDTNAVVT